MVKFKPRSFLTFLATICLIAILFFGFLGLRFLNKSLVITAQQPVDFIFESGNTVMGLAYKLHKLGVIYSPTVFILAVEVTGNSKKLHAGEYRVEPGKSLWHLLLMLKKGEVVKHSITFVEGWTFSQVKVSLQNNPYLVHELQGLTDEAIMQKIGASGVVPEGMFAPDTYVFSGKISDTIILRNAYSLMQKRLQTEWQKRAANVSYKCLYDALIVASMIEKESAFVAERPMIAGVIIKRLQLGMPLQIDATVIYGLGLASQCVIGTHCNLPQLKESDLKKDTRYNTYMYKGLPPTPIAMPGENALQAALHPIISDKIYYVAKPDGSHEFSSTLAEHNAARKKL